jgi:hypothetical protein
LSESVVFTESLDFQLQWQRCPFAIVSKFGDSVEFVQRETRRVCRGDSVLPAEMFDFGSEASLMFFEVN